MDLPASLRVSIRSIRELEMPVDKLSENFRVASYTSHANLKALSWFDFRVVTQKFGFTLPPVSPQSIKNTQSPVAIFQQEFESQSIYHEYICKTSFIARL
jgi:hypothetical protein